MTRESAVSGSLEIVATIERGQGPEDCIVLWGGDDSNPTWDEYLDGYKDEIHPALWAVRKAVEESRWMGSSADAFCNGHWFKFSEPVADRPGIAFTWRAWGDLMQAIVGKREGYMAYYM